jgi:hypothetical protein
MRKVIRFQAVFHYKNIIFTARLKSMSFATEERCEADQVGLHHNRRKASRRAVWISLDHILAKFSLQSI